MSGILSQGFQRGWSIIPTRIDKKARQEWAGFQHTRADTDQIRRWKGENPPCWAVITGKISQVVCVDFDGEAGARTLQTLGLQPHVRTGSGGFHVYVKHPGVKVKNCNGKTDPGLAKLYAGVDIRGDGGYAIFWGKSNKGEYTWLRPIDPDPWDVLPEDLRAYITQTSEPIMAEAAPEPAPDGLPMPPYDDPRYWLENYLEQAIVGSRNQMGYHLALELNTQCIQFGTSVSQAEAILCEYARRVPHDPKDPYTERDAKASLRKALDYGFKTPCGVPSPRTELIGRAQTSAEEVDIKKLATFAQTDLGNAERFLARHSRNLHYCTEFGKWFIWDGCRWEEDNIGTIVQLGAMTVRAILDEAATLGAKGKNSPRERLIHHARKSESDAKISAMLNLSRSWVGISADQLDADPWLLNCANGVLDLRSGELLVHRQDNLITKLIPYEYDSTAQCPQWLAFLNQIFEGNQHLIDYIQRAVGYALTGVIREQCLFFLHGSGANGKSTFLSVVQDIMGDYSRDTPSESLMVKKNEGISNDIARLKGARMVTAIETEIGRRIAESLVKRLTGGDTITARFMRCEFFQFRGTFKIFLAANHKPSIRGTDDAIWRRIKLIPFNVQIPDKDQDVDLAEKLKSEASGILAWMVAGCRLWQRTGLNEPAEVTEATAFYRDEVDYLGPFLSECCVADSKGIIPAGDLYRIYLQYCEFNKEKPLSQQKLGQIMSDRPHVRKGFLGHEKTRIYSGLVFSERVRTDADGSVYYRPCKNVHETYITDSTQNRPHPSVSVRNEKMLYQQDDPDEEGFEDL